MKRWMNLIYVKHKQESFDTITTMNIQDNIIYSDSKTPWKVQDKNI